MILDKIYALFERANREPVKLDEAVLDEFAAACRSSLKKQFEEPRESAFRLRMSNAGRAKCQIMMEARGVKREAPATFAKMRFLFGDLIEAASVAIMKTAGVKIKSQFQPVEIEVAGQKINGTYDIVAEEDGEDGLFDVKSSSSWSFQNKFSEAAGGFGALSKSDPFGYVVQGYLYAKAIGKRFLGWVVINKETGEWNVTPVPDDQEAEAAALKVAEDNVKALVEGEPFVRSFEDRPEYFKKAPTGNRILGTQCRYCEWKFSCWTNLQMRTDVNSKAVDPAVKFYTYVHPKYEKHSENE